MYGTREEWLQAAAQELREHVFAPAGATVPEVRVSVGFPRGRGGRSAIGQCWYNADDKVPAVFISPELIETHRKPNGSVLETLTHELAHAATPEAKGHRGQFRKLALAVGLQGKMTSTEATPELIETFAGIVERVGEYPHSRLTDSGASRQTTRMVKLECDSCGMVIRTTRKWLQEVGTPYCACGGSFLIDEASRQALLW